MPWRVPVFCLLHPCLVLYTNHPSPCEISVNCAMGFLYYYHFPMREVYQNKQSHKASVVVFVCVPFCPACSGFGVG